MAAPTLTPAPLAIVYTDLGRSTEIIERLGDVEARRLQRLHDQVIRSHVSNHGGIERRPTGDGFKLSFEDATRAVACAVDIQVALAQRTAGADPQLRVRIGIHMGRVIEEDGDVFGRTVVLASRVMSAARPGEILLSEEARQHVRATPAIDYVDRGIYTLKGLEGGFRIYEVTWGATRDVAGADQSVEPEIPSRTPFVGRRRELEALESSLDDVERDGSRVVLLEGAPGIGKTRLATEFVRAAERRRIAVAASRSYQELGAPYDPLLDALRQLLASGADLEIPDALAADLEPLARLAPDLRTWLPEVGTEPRGVHEERQRLRVGLVSLLVSWSESTPILLFLDDVQWLDAATLDWLSVLERRLAPAAGGRAGRLLLVLSARSSELKDAQKCRALLAQLERDHLLTRIVLGGLPPDDLRSLLRTPLGSDPGRVLALRLHERTEGNPLFAEAIARDLAGRAPAGASLSTWALETTWTVPREIAALLERQIERLAPTTLRVLEIAALMGQRISYQRLRAAAGGDEEALIGALEEASAAHILREQRDAQGILYAFDHSLVAQALRERLSEPRRQRAHLRIAEALRAHYGPRAAEHAVEIAGHLARAQDEALPSMLLHFAMLAGDAAAGGQAYEDARHQYEAALRALERSEAPSERQRALLDLRLVLVLGQLGALDRAKELADEAIQIFQRYRDARSVDAVRLAIASILTLHARHREALPYLRRAAERRQREPDAFRGELLAQYAAALDLVGSSDRMRRTAEELLALATQLRSRTLRDRARVLFRNWYANHTSDLPRARELTRRLLATARRRDDPWATALYWEQAGFFELTLGRVSRARGALDHALEVTQRLGTAAKIIDVRALRAMVCCFRGDWDGADEEWELSAPHLAHVPGSLRLGQLLWVRTRVDLWLGRGRPALPRDRDLYGGLSEFETAVVAYLGAMAAELGEPAAPRLLASAAKRQPRDGAGVNWLAGVQAIAAGWLDLGRIHEAAEWYEPLMPYAGTLSLEPTSLILGSIATRMGAWDDAARHLDCSARLCRREGLAPFAALTLVERARLVLMRGRRGSEGAAGRMLGDAHERLARLGMARRPLDTEELRGEPARRV